MSPAETVSALTLLELFGNPICAISQLVWQVDEEAACGSKAWRAGGEAAIFAIEFESRENSQLLIASTDTRLKLLRYDGVDPQEAITLARRLVDDLADGLTPIGFFPLDSAVCSVPEWPSLQITKATVVEANGGEILGLCVWANLGIRIGLFVSPFPGATLSFNDSCDIVLRQAMSAQVEGLLRVSSVDFPGKETPKQMDSIDWFDWLRDKQSTPKR